MTTVIIDGVEFVPKKKEDPNIGKSDQDLINEVMYNLDNHSHRRLQYEEE
jgi:hypothetical protein